MPRPLFYAILQIPGIVVVAALLYLAWRADYVGPVAAVVLLLLWIAKDVVLYPFVRHGLAGGGSQFVGAEPLLGAHGTVETRLAPRGFVRVGGERWSAESVDGGTIGPGERIRVEGLRSLVLLVVAAPAADLHD